MATLTTPVLNIERVLFLDARNRRFVERTSPITGRAQDAKDLAWRIVMILAIVGAVLSLAISTHTVDSRLAKSGKVTTGVITKKIQSRMTPRFCSVTYRFNGPPTYERESHIDYNLCPTLAVGQKVEVVYDPQQPLYANLKPSIESPRYPVLPSVVGFLGVLAAIVLQMPKVRRERRKCAEGQLICGSVVRQDIENGQLEVHYRYRHPAGFMIGAIAKGPVLKSNWDPDWRFFPDKPDQVVVLFLNDSEFYAL